MADHIRYDLLTQQALRGVVRNVLSETAKKGLIGEHHFYISFDTHAEGVRISDRMRAQYPEQMTVILQHQYWDLAVNERGFEVGLSFGGVPEKLFVTFESIKGFFDPSVQFGLQFEDVTEDEQEKTSRPDEKLGGDKHPVSLTAELPAQHSEPAPSIAKPDKKKSRKPVSEVRAEEPESPEKPAGAEVVRLDRFRKK
jgi:hypothetical protein